MTACYPIVDVALFPASYEMARQHWLTRVAGVPGCHRHLEFECPGEGPEGEALFTDSVWLGSDDAEAVLIVIAGTHGVEGFAGSAIQLDYLRLLQQGHIQQPENVALLFVHALTPWGYAWCRRCDADGVDLNRNAVDFSAALPINDGYRHLKSALWADDSALRRSALQEYERNHGRRALEIAVSGGQYLDPEGPFYGGQTPAHGRLVCEDLIERYALAKRRLGVIDLHTGLGPYGYGELICDHPLDSGAAELAARWYGDAVTLPLAGTSSSVPKTGLLDYLWHAVMGDSGCYVTLEFGSYSTEQLFDTLLRDHKLWAGKDNDAERIAHRQVMNRHFCPADPAWRELVLFRGRQVIGQALTGLGA